MRIDDYSSAGADEYAVWTILEDARLHLDGPLDLLDHLRYFFPTDFDWWEIGGV